MFLGTAASEPSFLDNTIKILNEYWPLFLEGIKITLIISITGTILGLLIGLFVAVIRTIPKNQNDPIIKKIFKKLINFILVAYIEVFRGTPMMVQAMVFYYGLYPFIRWTPFVAGLFIVSINTGSYMAEIVRSGIISIDKGQYEGAASIGMSHFQTMKSVIIPQAIRNIMPAIGNEFVVNIKDTSVLNVISMTELFFQAKSAAGRYMMFTETFTIIAIIYFTLTFTVTRILLMIEKRLDGPDTYKVMLTVAGSQTTPRALGRGK